MITQREATRLCQEVGKPGTTTVAGHVKAHMTTAQRQIAGIFLAAIVTVAGCGTGSTSQPAHDSTPLPSATVDVKEAPTAEEPADDELSPEAEDVEEALLLTGRADVAVSGSLEDDVLIVEVNAIDVRFLDVPAIDIVLDGFTIPTLPEDCIETVDGAACQMPIALRDVDGGEPSTESAVWTIQLSDTTPDTESSVNLIATSRDNPIDNDPDPTNNTLTLISSD